MLRLAFVVALSASALLPPAATAQEFALPDVEAISSASPSAPRTFNGFVDLGGPAGGIYALGLEAVVVRVEKTWLSGRLGISYLGDVGPSDEPSRSLMVPVSFVVTRAASEAYGLAVAAEGGLGVTAVWTSANPRQAEVAPALFHALPHVFGGVRLNRPGSDVFVRVGSAVGLRNLYGEWGRYGLPMVTIGWGI
jgi:hypothetical protein